MPDPTNPQQNQPNPTQEGQNPQGTAGGAGSQQDQGQQPGGQQDDSKATSPENQNENSAALNWKEAQETIKALKKENQEFKRKKEEEENQNLLKNKDFETLSQKSQARITELESELANNRKDLAINTRLAEAGITGKWHSLAKSYLSPLEYDKDSNSVSGLDEAMDKLKKDYPEFFAADGKKSFGTTNAGSGGSGLTSFTQSQVRDPNFYAKHEKEILVAMKEGRITNG